MKFNIKNISLSILVGILLFSMQNVIGQSSFQSQSEMSAKAAQYYASDQFTLAFPLYSQLLSLDPENLILNYRFGVCLLYTDRANTEEPFKYLEKSINQVTDIDLYYHLAVAYHNNYFFTDAINNYRKYLQLAQNNARKDYDVNRKIEMCQNGIEILKASNDLYVMQNSEVDKNAFYRSYDLTDFDGRIINLPENFLSKSDLKNEEKKVTFFNPNANLIFYALNNKNQKDIYYRTRQEKGEWSDAILLGAKINTLYDEDNPILMPDGKTLYFSSKGHNTMGGFDIFRSVYDSISNQWGDPVNLSFPFSTPSDDILFIPDADENTAWFASNRNSLSDKITVYKVGILKKEQAADLSDVYDKENLSSIDLGKIRNLAQLGINISDKEFKEIPVDEKHKLDALLKNEDTRLIQNIHQTNLINIDKQIAVQQLQTELGDSVKSILQQVDSKLEWLKSLYLQTQGFVSQKENLAQQAYTDVTRQLGKAQKTTITNNKKELVAEANKTLFKALRLIDQKHKLSNIEKEINNQIASQRMLLTQANIIFGDIQKNIIISNDDETKRHIRLLDELIKNADTLVDYTKVVNYAKGDLFDPNYPANLLDENSFAAYYIQNESEYLSPILAIETRFSSYIPQQSQTSDLELLRRIEKQTSTARLSNKEFSFQSKLMESFLNEKKQVSTQLLKEANQLVQTYQSKPSAVNINTINSKFAEARRAAFETHRAQQIYDSLQITNNRSEKIAAELTSLKSRIELHMERGENKEALVLVAQAEELVNQGNRLPTYKKSIDFEKKELVNLNYPQAIRSIDAYIEYSLKDGKLQRRSGEAFAYQNADEMIASSVLLTDEAQRKGSTSEPRLTNEQAVNATESITVSSSRINPTNQQIRESLAKLNQKQTKQLEELRRESVLLKSKATEKSDASNVALQEFERMHELYNSGQIKDQKSVLDKQKESENLLYQSLAIKAFADKIDSIIQTKQKQKEESTNQIFAIEQALQTDQPEKAQALYRALNKELSLPDQKAETLVQKWIENGVENISKHKTQANVAFENSQKLTDSSIQLLLEAKEIRADAQNKSNVFKQRELLVEAENKESLAIQKQDEADKQLALGTSLYEGIKKAEAIQLIAGEFSAPVMLAVNTNPFANTEKQPDELKKPLEQSKNETSTEISRNLPVKTVLSKSDLKKTPELNDVMAYETKKYKVQLLADALNINKTETIHFIEVGKTLSGAASIENNQKIAGLQKEADSLQKASSIALVVAENSYKQLPAKDKKLADNSNVDFDSYLKNVRDRIAQLLDDVSMLSEKASATNDVPRRDEFIRQADEKEQIANYLILEEYEIIAQRNKQNYRKNSLVIDQLLQEYHDKQEKELLQSSFDQIDAYMLQATNKYIRAKSEELSFNLKKALLHDAFLEETKALELQMSVIRTMREKETERLFASPSENKNPVQPPLLASTEDSKKSIEKNTLKNEQKTNERKVNKIEELYDPPLRIFGNKKTQEEKPNETKINKIEELNDPPLRIFGNKKTQEEKPVISTEDQNNTKIFSGNPVPADKVAVESPNSSAFVSLGKEPTDTQFSVQIAAIGTLKTTDNFRNVDELFALKDKEKELYRYFSGTFSNLKTAIIRRNALRSQGYSDAFIKSWKDGKPVSISLAAGELDEETNELLNNSVIALPSQYQNVNFSATDISQLTGIYYTVQIGVFSRPRSSAQLFDIKPLYHSRLRNGNWVYYNGIFKRIADAEVNKTAIHSKGIPDAFVVAFKNGEKVSFATARQSIRYGLTQPTDQDIIVLEDAALEIDNQLKSIISPSNNSSTKKVYKIQIGVFSQAVSFDWASKLSSPNNYPIEYFINNAGKYVYTIGSFNSYEEASEFNAKQVKAFINDAFIVTFVNGNKM